MSHVQIRLNLYAQDSQADEGSASASPFLLGIPLTLPSPLGGEGGVRGQDLVSSARSTLTSGGASIPKRTRPFFADCTTVIRMDSLMRMLSPTFRERTSMIDSSMMLLALPAPP